MKLSKYSFGIGDRFGMQGSYQLKAFILLEEQGIPVTPVWNKSHREHLTVGTKPASVMEEALKAVSKLNRTINFHVDADHITLKTVNDYIEHADFFTIDVAEQIGKPLSSGEMEKFLETFTAYPASPSSDRSFVIDESHTRELGDKYWKAALEAGRIYSLIASKKGGDNFIAEISMDEVPHPQSPTELYFILKMMRINGVHLQTIAPRFPGRFNKGIDYEGNLSEFESLFRQYLSAVKSAINDFMLPENLKLSIHTGSDKFSLYPIMNRLIKEADMGIHLKTAGTTWLEEAIGLAEGGDDATRFIAAIYSEAFDRFEELTSNYSTVLNIDRNELLTPEEFSKLQPDEMGAIIRHDKSNNSYNPHVRQLMHTAYKIAGENYDQFQELVADHEISIGTNVCDNILNRHLKPLFT